MPRRRIKREILLINQYLLESDDHRIKLSRNHLDLVIITCIGSWMYGLQYQYTSIGLLVSFAIVFRLEEPVYGVVASYILCKCIYYLLCFLHSMIVTLPDFLKTIISEVIMCYVKMLYAVSEIAPKVMNGIALSLLMCAEGLCQLLLLMLEAFITLIAEIARRIFLTLSELLISTFVASDSVLLSSVHLHLQVSMVTCILMASALILLCYCKYQTQQFYHQNVTNTGLEPESRRWIINL